MPGATLKFVAELAGVAPVTVSRVVNGSENVAAATREKILAIIRGLDYTPNIHAANLRRKRLNDQSTNGSKDQLVCANQSLRTGCNSCVNIPCPPQGAFIFTPEEDRAFAQQINRLRRDLDRLREHTERIQTCVDIIQEAYSRRLSSYAAH
jgi:transcriptional regulator with XRE-family HTH domain